MPRRSGGGGGRGGADWYSAGRGRGGAAGRGGKRGKKGDADKKHRRKAKAGAEEAAARPSVRQQPERNPLPPATTSSEDEEANNDDGGGETRHPQLNIVPDATAAAAAAPGNATELKPVPTKIEDLSATDTVADALNKLSEAAYDCAAGISVGLGPEIVKRIKKKHARELAVLADVLFNLRNRVSLEGMWCSSSPLSLSLPFLSVSSLPRLLNAKVAMGGRMGAMRCDAMRSSARKWRVYALTHASV